MKAYRATFTKKNGELRTMIFAKLTDVPKDKLPVGKGGKAKKLPEGQELVWDLERRDYRVFNESAVVGSVEEFETEI